MSDETMSMLDDRIAELEDENAALQRENAALRADLLIEEERSIYWRDNENKAMAENAALRDALEAQMKYQRELRADRDRLDWVLTPIGFFVVYGHIRDNLLLTRDNIDRAMGVKA
jgi:regulator of replication initiation timing